MTGLFKLFGLVVVLVFSACKSMSESDRLDGEGGSSVMAAASDNQNNIFMRNMRIKESKDRLMALFDEGRGVWIEAEWWQHPNILETLAEYERQFPGEQPQFSWVAEKVFEKNKGNSFINEFFDDTGWWGLAWIRSYEVTREQRYLEMSKKIFDYLTREGWVDGTCKGGLRWKTDNGVKNAITTEVFLRLALRLYINTPESDTNSRNLYRSWAFKTWNWFNESGLLRRDTHQVTDKLDMTDCKNRDNAAFTYNQGVILGALVDLYTISGKDQRYLDLAHKIAMANWQYSSKNQVLIEFGGDSNPGLDGPIFKGIFMRNLNYLFRHLSVEQKNQHRPYLIATAKAVWKHRNQAAFFNTSWAAPTGGDAMHARSHVAGLDALLAAPVFSDGPYVPDVCFYEKWGFMGRQNCYAVPEGGLAYRDFFDQGLNDNVTSVRVFPGACLTVYEHWSTDPSKRGKALTFNGGSSGKSEWLLTELGINDIITSFEARRCQ
jgi:predicted alpha-1,6-mannanase (GH76 family)